MHCEVCLVLEWRLRNLVTAIIIEDEANRAGAYQCIRWRNPLPHWIWDCDKSFKISLSPDSSNQTIPTVPEPWSVYHIELHFNALYFSRPVFPYVSMDRYCRYSIIDTRNKIRENWNSSMELLVQAEEFAWTTVRLCSALNDNDWLSTYIIIIKVIT